ncbi:hypothetical protein EON68_04555 [archaeon]|nr:MAG: hypothetical protein EON68_04555 [archaeon]
MKALLERNDFECVEMAPLAPELSHKARAVRCTLPMRRAPARPLRARVWGESTFTAGRRRRRRTALSALRLQGREWLGRWRLTTHRYPIIHNAAYLPKKVPSKKPLV